VLALQVCAKIGITSALKETEGELHSAVSSLPPSTAAVGALAEEEEQLTTKQAPTKRMSREIAMWA